MAKELGIIIADFQTSLAGKIAIGDVSGTLLSATDDDGVILPDGRYFFTIDSDNSSKEHISCDLVGTTKAITNIKTVARGTGVETVGTLREHRIGATVTITDFAHIKKIQDLLDGTTDLDSDTPLKYDGDPTITDDKHLATKKYADDLAIAGSPDASTSVKGIAKLSVAPASPTEPITVGDNDDRIPTQDENDALEGTSGTPSAINKFITNLDSLGTGSVVRSSYVSPNFGGDGSDGDLIISSGTTTIDLGGALYFEKNYSLISITDTGALAFSNPNALGTIICLKSSGNVIITSSASPAIDLRLMGSLSGIAGVGATSDVPQTAGGDGSLPSIIYSFFALVNTSSKGGQLGYGSNGGASGIITTPIKPTAKNVTSVIFKNLLYGMTGAGGGGGAGGNYYNNNGLSGGAGGRGAGSLIIECNGVLDKTSVIDASGATGENAATGSTQSNAGGGGGGGGAGGFVALLCRTINTNTGAINIAGGNGGSGSQGGGGGLSVQAGGGGAGGSSLFYRGGAGGAGGYYIDQGTYAVATRGLDGLGTSPGSGGNSSASISSGGGGGGGASGFSLVASL